ncbi:MAG: hypothetical protein KDA88_23250 [Planctomycetaceae bacterium]|nr:hypothetical protein [Planctomycetaceae bacterium]MCB9951769.1 hypothetical protein [Planctomycetaceae bacterium]
MSLEDVIANENSRIFTREFTFSATLFDRSDGQEVELCDGAVWIDDLLLLFQIKERNPHYDTHDAREETKWFERKVEKDAVGQFVDTLRYLREENSLPFANHRGQTLDFALAQPTRIHLIALFDSSEALPLDVASRKGRTSKRVGFVHYFHRVDYQAICLILHTPTEIAEYLHFRANFVQRNEKANRVSEKALFGKFLTDADDSNDIRDEHEFVVDRLVDDRDDFNISRLLAVYFDRIAYGNEGTQYHAILSELAKLPRNMLREFRKRFEWAMSKCHDDALAKPSRFYSKSQECSFIAIPLPTEERRNWQEHLNIYTRLCKYDFKSKRCLGFTTAIDADRPDAYAIHWCHLNFDWQPIPEMEAILAEENWFRDTKEQLLGKYKLR